MSFTDHKITQFQHKIADLADQPTLPPDELKARFDSSPEELRQAHNALCDDADRLDARVSGIVAETFGDTIPKSMLSNELQDELDAKATQTALAAEATAREALAETVAQKCEIYVGSYVGNTPSGVGGSQKITLGFRPKAVMVMQNGYRMDGTNTTYVQNYGGLATEAWQKIGITINNDGFTVQQTYTPNEETGVNRTHINTSNQTYLYIVFR